MGGAGVQGSGTRAGRRAAVAGLALSAVLAGGAFVLVGPAEFGEPARANLAVGVALADEGTLPEGARAAADAGVALASEGEPGAGLPALADDADADVVPASEGAPDEGMLTFEGGLPAGDAGGSGDAGAGDVAGGELGAPNAGAGDAGASDSDGVGAPGDPDVPGDPDAPANPEAPADPDAPSDGGDPVGSDGTPEAPDAANPDDLAGSTDQGGSSDAVNPGGSATSPDATAPADPAAPSDAANPADSSQTDAVDESQRTGTRFSLLDEGLLTPVRNQGSYEMCWSFGYLSSLESTVLRATGASLELSPFQSAYFMMMGDDETEHATNGNPYASVDPYAGVGPTYWLTGSLAAGKGAAAVVPGVNDWGNPSFDESLRYESTARLTDAMMLYDAVAPFWEEPADEERAQVIKDLVRNVGPVVAQVYGHMDGDVYSYEHGSWRVPQDGGYYTDHLVSIVGWDDDYPRENFVTQPESDGAWLIKNSWGTDYANEGYFWLSYDSLFEAQTVLIGELAREGEKTYQFDEVGWMDSMTLGGTDAFMANVFTSERAETLDRAMFVTTGRNTAYTVSVYRNPVDANDPLSGELVSMTKGVQQWPGYHTVSLDAPVELSAGDTFALVVHVQNESYAYPIAVETFSPDPELPGAVPSHMGRDAAGNPEVSLVSADGVSWEDPAGYGRELAVQGGDRSYVTNVSVKGLTVPREEVVDPEPDPEPDPDPDPDPTPDPDPDPMPDPGPDPEPGPEPEPNPDPEPDPKPDPDPDPDDPTPSPDPDPTPTPDPSPQPDPEPGTNPGTGDKVPGGEGGKPGTGKDELPQTGDATLDALPAALGVAGAGVLAGAGVAAMAAARRRRDA